MQRVPTSRGGLKVPSVVVITIETWGCIKNRIIQVQFRIENITSGYTDIDPKSVTLTAKNIKV